MVAGFRMENRWKDNLGGGLNRQNPGSKGRDEKREVKVGRVAEKAKRTVAGPCGSPGAEGRGQR